MATTTESRDYTATIHIIEDEDALRRCHKAANPLYCNNYLVSDEGALFAPPKLEMAVTISEL